MSVQLSVRSANAEDDMIASAKWLRNERELPAGALTTWLQNRPRTTIKITRGDVSIEIDATRIEDLPAPVEKLVDRTDDATR